MGKTLALKKTLPTERTFQLNLQNGSLFQKIIDSLDFYVMLVDCDHTILAVNRAVKRALGVDPDRIIGQYCPKVVHGLDEPFPGCPLEEACKKSRIVKRDLFDDRIKRWLGSAIYPTSLETESGKKVFFHIVKDITEQKKAQDEVLFKNMLLDHASDSIFVVDLKGKIVYVNEAAYKTRGYTKKEMIGMPIQELDAPESAIQVKSRIKTLVKKGMLLFEAVHIKKDGSPMYVEVNARVVKHGQNKIITSVVRDITSEKNAENAIKLAQNEVTKFVDEHTRELCQRIKKQLNTYKK